MYYYIGTSRTPKLIDLIHKDTSTGKSIFTCTEDLVSDIGLYGLVWDMPFDFYSKYVERHSWKFSCLEYNSKHNISLSIERGTLSPLRIGDDVIIKKVGCFTTKTGDMRAINQMWVTFNLASIRDISSVNDAGLDTRFLYRRENKLIRNSYIWLLQHHDSDSDYRIW